VLLSGARAHGGEKDAQIVATEVAVEPMRFSGAATTDERVRRATVVVERALFDAVTDLGLVARPRGSSAAHGPRRHEERTEDWRVGARLTPEAEALVVRIFATPPGSLVELAREERFLPAELGTLEVRTAVMLRDLLVTARGAPHEASLSDTPALPPPRTAPTSSGRSALSLSSAVFGGYFGFTIQKASQSKDTRIVYPLVALGAGLGLGASLLVADEWDVTQGDASYLTAGALWPAAAGFFLADGYQRKESDRFTVSLGAAIGGLGLATVGVATANVTEGDALLAHSGGAFGGVFGSMIEMAARGQTSGSLRLGFGWGAATGVTVLGAAATVVDLSASRVLLLDLSVSLGGLAGAAAASPLLLAHETDAARTRLWLGGVGLGAVAGGVVGFLFTPPGRGRAGGALPFVPYASLNPSAWGNAYDLGVTGRW
jgi:hypothetical protein